MQNKSILSNEVIRVDCTIYITVLVYHICLGILLFKYCSHIFN